MSRPINFFDDRLPDRFWRRVIPEPNSGCWLWTGFVKDGYGEFWITHTGHRRVHRVAYEALVGPIPDGLVPKQRCGQRLCVNPDHVDIAVYVRTPADLTGERSGRLTVMHLASEWRARGKTLWTCACDCGNPNPKIVRADVLRAKAVRSCGCLQSENSKRLIAAVNAEESAEWNALLDTLCEEVLTRFPQRPKEIREALAGSWGDCGERRFWRALRLLVDQGRAVRTGKAQCNETSMYALPVAARRRAA